MDPWGTSTLNPKALNPKELREAERRKEGQRRTNYCWGLVLIPYSLYSHDVAIQVYHRNPYISLKLFDYKIPKPDSNHYWVLET